MVTYRLADALPLEVIERCLRELRNDAERRKRLEAHLDAGLGGCVLRQPSIAEMVVANWKYFEGIRYDLHAWVVMPNHVHLLVDINSEWSLEQVLHSWKSYSAHEINRMTFQAGQVWEAEYWDRAIRDERHYLAAVTYIHENPVKAGLVECAEDWPWSSARLWMEERRG